MPNTKAGSSRQFQEGDAMDSIGKSAESWLKTERVPELPKEAPTNMALMYVGNYIPEAEADFLPKVMSRDVVVVARGSELASHYATRFAASGGSLWVVDCLDPLAWEGYLSWLAKLAGRYPHTKVFWVKLAVDPVKDGRAFAGFGELELRVAMELAPRVFKEFVENPIPPVGRPAELFLRIPVDDVPHWAKGKRDGSTFIVPAEKGALCVEPRRFDPGHTLFYVCRLETGENVAYTHLITDGERENAIDADVWGALEPFPEGAELVLRPIPYSELKEAKATEPRNGDSAEPRDVDVDVDEDGETNEPDNG